MTRWIEWALLIVLSVALVNLAKQELADNPFRAIGQTLEKATGRR